MSTASLPAAKSVSSRMLRRALSFPVMIAGLLTMLAALTVRARFDDPDMWWHLKVGEIVWTTHTIPTTDTFSFTTNHHAWVPHEWLAQTIIYAAYRWGGYTGLMLWFCLFASALFVAGYALCTLYSKNAKVSFLGALVIFVFATIGLAIRPQMIGYLLLILELILIHLGRTRSPRWFWLLPPLFALWINCHGSFFLGILVAAAFLFSSYFEFHIGSLRSNAWNPHSRRTLLISWILSLGALFLNADGIHPILYPLQTMLQLPLGLSSVEEWQPLQFNSQRGVFLLAVLACIVLLCIARRAELYLDELILLAAATWLAAGHTRMVFVFGILAAPVLSRMIAPFWDDYSLENDHLWPNAVLLFGALVIAFFAFPDKANLTAQVEEKSPARAVEFIQSHHLSGPMLNAYTFGGYLLWAMPEHPVFVDGRGDVFEWTGVLQQFGQWASLEADPNTLLDKYGIQFCLLERGSPMTFVLPLTHSWKPIYSDNNAVIFVRTTSAPQPR